MNLYFGKIATAFMAFALASSLQATTLYSPKTITLMSDSGKELGMLTPLTPVEKIEEKDKMVKIAIKGWSAYGAQTVVFQKIGIRVIYAIINDEGVKNIKKGKTQTDDYESEWTEVTLNAWVNKADVQENNEEIEKNAMTLFDERCGACHQAHHSDEFTANQWPNIIKSMRDRAGLNGDEEWLLAKYMQLNAKDMK